LATGDAGGRTKEKKKVIGDDQEKRETGTPGGNLLGGFYNEKTMEKKKGLNVQ